MSRFMQGFSLIDVIVGISLMLVLFLALFGVLRASLVLSTLAKAKAAGVELANTQMEYLHGLSYDALGTVGGIPAGLVPQATTTLVDGVNYTLHTLIEYYDDPADGLGVSDTSGVTTDYKIGKVTVTYALSGITKSIALISTFVPPSIESSTGGGTLSLHIVDAAGLDVSDAAVHIVNALTLPTIDFTTFSDTGGLVTIGGAATSSAYQIYVSKGGYSSAQTYARVGQNENPTPGYLTITKDQTTNATFAIDTLASLTFRTFSPASTTAFSDIFASAGNLGSQTSTQVTGGELILASESLFGIARSKTISPSAVDGWGLLQADMTGPAGTSAVIHIDDVAGTPLPDSALAGNSAGFSSFPVFLTGISTTTYPALVLEADLTSDATSTTPAIQDWSLSYTAGPVPLPSVVFTLTGDKSIGTTAAGAAITKTIVNDTSGAAAAKTLNLEWDAYTLTVASATLIQSCPYLQPFLLLPASSLDASAIAGTPSSTTLPIEVTDSASSTIANAKIVLSKSDYAATLATDVCGLAYFNGLGNGTYTATVSAAGHTTTVFPGVSAAGQTALTTLVLP